MSPDEPTLGELFHRDPTRELEEVQKVNATDQALDDIDEFHETESASTVLQELGTLVQRDPREDPRFLYLHATFGSGKTHLLKLVGFATGEQGPDPAKLVKRLREQFPGFADFIQTLDGSRLDHLVPVFLNLLDRDASKEPPLPMMIYEALGRELGFPTDPRWLLAWVWQLEMETAPGLWDALRSFEHGGRTFEEVLKERGGLRAWLYDALPAMEEGRDAGFTDEDAVRASIEEAQATVDAAGFGPKALVERVKEATAYLTDQRGGTAELLLGLDEVALFVGDDQERYEEFLDTVQALINGPNPVIAGTGQWPPGDIHESFFTESDPPDWFLNHVELRGADTEIIVRKRWLRKDPDHRSTATSVLEDGTLDPIELPADVELADRDAVEAYPFRDTDLWLLREVMQGLLGRGLATEHEHIQGRALLVVVRSLFTKRGWADEPLGALVPWDQLFDLLAEDEVLIPSWVMDLIDRLETTLEGVPRAVETAKTIYLVGNHAPRAPATAHNIARLLADRVDADLDDVEAEVRNAIETLEDKRYIHERDEHGGEPTYELLSRDEVTLAEKIGRREVSHPQLRSRIETWLLEEPLLQAEDRRHEVDVGDERKVPMRYAYSILRGVRKPSSPPYDAVGVRVLAGREDIEANVDQWTTINGSDGGAEDLLVVVELSEAFLDKLGRMIATRDVLSTETQRYADLESNLRDDEQELEETLTRRLHQARVLLASGEELGTFSEVFGQAVVDRVVRADEDPKFPKRKVLTKGPRLIDLGRDLKAFFAGEGPWPLDRADAEMLGVDVVNNELSDGWAGDFLDRYGEETIVDGPTLLDEIHARGGAYLGTPLESLAALLLTLAAADEIELRRDGQSLQRPDEMGRALRTMEDLRRLEVRMEPPVDRSRLAALAEVHQALLDQDSAPDDPDAILDEVAEWTRHNGRLLREVDQALAQQFTGDITLADLHDALAPALEGEPLDAARLTEDPVQDQAAAFAKARALLQGEHQDTWDRFLELADLLERHYPREQLTVKVQRELDADALPDPSRLQNYVDDAGKLRVETLTRIHEGLTGDEPPTDDPDEIPAALTDWLGARADELTATLDDAEAKLPATFETIRDLVSTVQAGTDLTEGDLVDPDLDREVQALHRARQLLDERNGDTLWGRLQATHDKLEDAQPDANVTARLGRALASSSLPDQDTAESLIEAGEQTLETGDEPETPDEPVEALMQEIEALEPGSIVLIDPKGRDGASNPDEDRDEET